MDNGGGGGEAACGGMRQCVMISTSSNNYYSNDNQNHCYMCIVVCKCVEQHYNSWDGGLPVLTCWSVGWPPFSHLHSLAPPNYNIVALV